jgi:hypothetical protein
MSQNLLMLDVIHCDADGCRACYQGSAFSFAADARREAKAEGWQVNVKDDRWSTRRRKPRLDFCPEHKEVLP